MFSVEKFIFYSLIKWNLFVQRIILVQNVINNDLDETEYRTNRKIYPRDSEMMTFSENLYSPAFFQFSSKICIDYNICL